MKLKPGELFQCTSSMYTFDNKYGSVMNGKISFGETFLIVRKLGKDPIFKRVTYQVYLLASKKKVCLYLMDIKRASKKITIAPKNE